MYKISLPLFCALIPTLAAHAADNAQLIRKSTDIVSNMASTNFSGRVRHESLLPPHDGSPYSVSSVTFEPGARTFWHSHPLGQNMIVTSGIGLTDTADGNVYIIKAGDTIWCPPNVKHWHGAMPNRAMTHMVVTNFDKD